MLIATATELPRLMQCIGSYGMPRVLPVNMNQDAIDEGNAAHWFAQRIFDGSEIVIGQRAPNGVALTDEMKEHVHSYVSALDCGEMETNTSYSGETWSVNGRADHIVLRDRNLIVDDLKYGWRIVEPENNWTLISHAVGRTVQLGLVGGVDYDHVTLRIHQPRPYHPSGPLREWAFPAEDIPKFWDEINQRLSSPDDTLTTGFSHCHNCHALASCPAARQASMNAIDATTRAFTDDLDSDALTFEYQTLEIAQATIKNRLQAIEEMMVHRIKTGSTIENYSVEPRYANRKWKTGFDGAMLSALAGIDLTKPGAVTPAEAERRGVPKETVMAFTERPVIGEKLQRIDADQKARRIFNGRNER